MKAIVELDVPGFQIGQEVTVYFKDTMQTKGVCVASPIVRCKDCRKSVCYDRVDGTKIYTCKNICGVMSGEYFCADGVRK